MTTLYVAQIGDKARCAPVPNMQRLVATMRALPDDIRRTLEIALSDSGTNFAAFLHGRFVEAIELAALEELHPEPAKVPA